MCFYLRGSEVFDQLGSCHHEVSGALDEIGDFTPVPLFYATTASNGRPLDGSTLLHLQQQLLDAIETAGNLDGLLLVTMGAMASEIDDDATGHILQEECVSVLRCPEVKITAMQQCST